MTTSATDFGFGLGLLVLWIIELMCGIIGYVGKKAASPVLLEGLRRLEYRGYDSAGVAILQDADLLVRKKKGRIDEGIARELLASPAPGEIGIAHTRWATHGAPCDENSHPHLDQSGQIAVVHNGVIENYDQLKQHLLKAGHQFYSTTDTFHSTVKSAASFVADGSEGIGTHLNSDGRAVLPRRPDQKKWAAQQRGPTGDVFQTFHVNGMMPTARREREMRDFRAAARAVMSNARCLTEGVDVPAVDMVAFLSPRRSRVDIVQATGRAMRRSPG